MLTVHAQAREMLASLETRTRANGESFICVKDDSPEWIGDAIRVAHGDFMPNDWRYELIERALSAILESSDPEDDENFDEDEMSEQIDSAVDVYTGRLTSWLASNLQRVCYYCDREAKEYGPFDSMVTWIQAGQICELREIADSLLATFRDRAESED